MIAAELLEYSMRTLNLNDPVQRVRRPGFKISCPSVRDLMSQLSEAETNGDQRTFRRLDNILKDTRRYHNRLFVFAEDARPGYLGTLTDPFFVHIVIPLFRHRHLD